MNHPFFLLQEVKQIDLVDYLEKLGYQPQKIRNNDYWYLSPLRQEKEASFKVDRKLNLWYDHGLGKGGSIIDFAMLYHNCRMNEVPQKISDLFSLHRETPTVQQPRANAQKAIEALEPKIKVIAAKPLTNPALCRYLTERKIAVESAEKYCKEVNFEMYGRQYFAIGFENKSGGFELRNQHFKGSSSPKDITEISTPGATDISVFEGFISFLSYQTLYQKDAAMTNFLILNSLSFFEKSRQLMEEHEEVSLYLDRDKAGMHHTQSALNWHIKYTDKSQSYKNYKDLNDYLVHQSQQQKQGFKLRRHH